MHPDSEKQKKHEDRYKKLIDSTIDGVDTNRFTEAAIPRILNGLKAELAQCIELLMISPEFYREQMDRLQHEVTLVMER